MDIELNLIIGFGKTGTSCLDYFLQRGMPVAVIDSRQQPPGAPAFEHNYPGVAHHFGSFDSHLFEDATRIVLSPGISLQTPQVQAAIARGVTVIGDIDLFLEQCPGKVIAITGTNGKSTVTSWVADMAKRANFRAQLAGNIGRPVLDVLHDEPADFYILELSSFQLETCQHLQAFCACILNISEDHLDRYASFDDYIQAKHRIYRQASYQVYNADDAHTFPSIPSETSAFSLKDHNNKHYHLSEHAEDKYLTSPSGLTINTKTLALQGLQNIANALAVMAIAERMSVPEAAIRESLSEFSGLAHRCEWLRVLHGVNWYNDSKGTNVGASIAAIEGLGSQCQGSIVLLAGGRAKESDFTLAKPALLAYVSRVICYGEAAPLLLQAFNDVAQTQLADDFATAVHQAQQHAQKNDIVLLSPMCASFDMFQNFEERGEVFRDLVFNLT